MQIDTDMQANGPRRRRLNILLGGLFLALLAAACSPANSDRRTTPATADIKGQLIDRAHLADAGNATPEAALESAFWLKATGDYDADIASYVPQMREQAKQWDGSKVEFTTQMKRNFERFKGLQIMARKTVASDKVDLFYRFEFAGERAHTKALTVEKVISMVNLGGAWKCGETTSHTADWDSGSVPEPR